MGKIARYLSSLAILAYVSLGNVYAQGYAGKTDYEIGVWKDATTPNPFFECLELFYKEGYELETQGCLEKFLDSGKGFEFEKKQAKSMREHVAKKIARRPKT